MSKIQSFEPERKSADGSSALTVVDKIRFLTRLAGDSRLNATDLRCGIVIADYFNTGKGRAWPSYTRLVEKTGASRASVARAVRKLDALAIIQKSSGHKNHSNSYYPAFRVDELNGDAAPETLNVDASGAIAPSHQRDLGGLNGETTSVSDVRHNPSTTPRSNQRRGSGGIPSGPPALRAPAGGAPPFVNEKPTGQQLVAVSLDGFEAFWRAYPKKEGRNNTIRAYRFALAQSVNPALLAEKAEQYSVAKAGNDPRYLKMPATWLQDQCWLEDPQPPKPKVQRVAARGKGAGGKAGKGKTGAPSPKSAAGTSKRKATPGRKRGPDNVGWRSSVPAADPGRAVAPAKREIRIAGTAYHHDWGKLSIHHNGAAAFLEAWTAEGRKVRVRRHELRDCDWTPDTLAVDRSRPVRCGLTAPVAPRPVLVAPIPAPIAMPAPPPPPPPPPPTIAKPAPTATAPAITKPAPAAAPVTPIPASHTMLDTYLNSLDMLN
jgi:hypothetical protein